jgi:glutamate-ammonia-ligase adenylyltransferase
MEDNIKLGRGGIREIEFIGQAFQLIRGGRDPRLRQRGILGVLHCLGEQGLLARQAAAGLAQAYEFLRRVENRLQAMADRQTHSLPTEALGQARLAFAMDCVDWTEFRDRLDRWRQLVQTQFDQVFAQPTEAAAAPAGSGAEEELGDLWLVELEDKQAEATLRSAGFADAAEAWRLVQSFRSGGVCRVLSANGRRRLDHLMPLLLAAAARSQQPDAALARLLTVLEAIARRTAYLALLVESPMALAQLVQLCAASPWVARHLARHPVLLDELLDQRTLYAPLGKEELQAELAIRLEAVTVDDLEQQMEVLRYFKQAHTLRVAAADITAAVPLMVVSDYLTYLAETVLDAVLRLACRKIVRRYPQAGIGSAADCGIAIIAYGKLGGIELGYGSDLDLVFLHADAGDAVAGQAFFGRVTQRIIHMLGTPTAGGVLYEADTRLRPSGKAGLLATTLPAFAEYQRNSAWTWEHQALVRARPVAGNAQLANGFEQVRREILRRARDPDRLRQEVREMRDRQLNEKGVVDSAWFDLKNDRGGIADIEFLVQYGVLSRAADYPELVRYTDNIRLLDDLSDTGWISADEARLLADAYRTFRARLHRLTLQEEPGRVASTEFVEQRALVGEFWQRLMECD